MSNPTIHPVILCGGSGTRLWPLSRKKYPKQFGKIVGENSLFQESVLRVAGSGVAAPLIVTGDDYRFVVTEQLAQIERDSQGILIEPQGKNTAPAVLAAALWLQRRDPEGLMLVTPSDHLIPDTVGFMNAVNTAATRALAGDLVTFGIAPSRAETGYGWLELENSEDRRANKAVPLVRFVEKPARDDAEAMLDAGRFLWNAGIFLFSIKAIVAAFKKHAPEMLAQVQASVDETDIDLGFVRLAPDEWTKVEGDSIDYAIMEHAENLAVMPYDGSWSDLGGWEAVWLESDPDPDSGTVAGERVTAIDCTGSLLRSDAPGQEIVGIGLNNIVAVAMKDAVLVADKSQAQRVKEAVAKLRAEEKPQADEFPVDRRPWGWFESLAKGRRFQVKRIVVNPGASLSLQSHFHRAEHWIVVAGTAKVTIDDDVKLVRENESVYVPLGAVHRLENPGKTDVIMIEVQTGSYLGEDDIVRYEDVYARK